MDHLGNFMLVAFGQVAADVEGNQWYSTPEELLAIQLRNRGLTFERQKHVSRGKTFAILDFWVENMLCVEVDGRQFHNPVTDQHRNVDLWREHGFHTQRFKAAEVLCNSEAVVCQIAAKLLSLEVGA